MDKTTEILNKTTADELFCMPCDAGSGKKVMPCPLEFEFVVGNRTVVPPQYSTRWRTMPFHLCVVGTLEPGNGCRVRFKNRKSITLTGPKTFVFIPAGTTHCIEDIGSAPRISEWIHFHLHCLNVFDAFTELRLVPLAMPLPDNGIETLVRKIIGEPGTMTLGESIRHQMYGISLCMKILELASPAGAVSGMPSERKQRLFPALELLNGTGEKPDIATLAAAVHLSPSRFLNLFVQEMGISAGQYYKRNLFGRACRLLADPGKSIAECADELGFADPCHFSREFHKYSGITPSCYRKELFRSAGFSTGNK